MAQENDRQKFEQACMRALHNSAYEEGKNRIPVRVPGTCEWILRNPKFIQWRETRNGLMWLTAKPGNGKSVLCRALVDEQWVTSHAHDSTICYFFFSDATGEGSSLAKALAALLYQTFKSKPTLIHHALDAFRVMNYKLCEDEKTMWKIFCAAANDIHTVEIVCVLDALDECESEDRDRLLRWLVEYYSDLTTSKSNLKFLITSRPQYEIERGFQTLIEAGSVFTFANEEGKEEIQKEVNVYIEQKISDLAHDSNLSEASQAALAERLQERAESTFSWVALTMRQLKESRREEDIEKLLEQLPKTLESTYENLLGRNPDRTTTLRMLTLIAIAERPLSIQELNIALSLRLNDRANGELRLEDSDTFLQKIRTTCGPLVQITESKVYLVHASILDFLISDGTATTSSEKWQHSIETTKSHLTIVEICVSYLLFDYFETNPLDLASEDSRDTVQVKCDGYTIPYPLLSYAADNWAYHFTQAKDTPSEALVKRAVELCRTDSGRFSTWFGVYWTNLGIEDPVPEGFTDLIAASYFGLDSVVRVLINQGANINEMDSAHSTALHYSSSRGQYTTVQLLLSHKASTATEDSSGSRALHKAAENGHDDIVLLLLQNAAEIDAKDKSGATALHVATNKGDKVVVKVLLDNHADFLSLAGGETLEQLAAGLAAKQITDDAKERYNSVLRLLKGAASASLGLAQGPSLPVDRKFKANIVYFPKDTNQNILRDMKEVHLNELFDGQIDMKVKKESLICQWFHLPANNMQWIERLLPKISEADQQRLENDETRNAVLGQEFWENRQHRGSSNSRICFMRPMAKTFTLPSGLPEGSHRDATCIYMPYIHWETKSKQLDMDFFFLLRFLLRLLKRAHKMTPTADPSWRILSNDDMEILKGYLQAYFVFRIDPKHAIHPSRLNRARNPAAKSFFDIEAKESPELDIPQFWTLNSADLELFRAQPGGNRDANRADAKQYLSKSPTEVLKAFQECHNFILSREPEKDLVSQYVDERHPLHIRRTLDQSYYYMLDNTRKRNEEQVVSRYSERYQSSRKHKPVVMMVDQLWLWVIEGGLEPRDGSTEESTSLDTIITCFPQRLDTEAGDPDKSGMTDVFQSILRNSARITHAADLRNFIIQECWNACFGTSKVLREELRFLEIFESSIGAVANAEAACYDRFVNELDPSEHLDVSKIQEESNLLREIKDILDELNMMEMIFEEQIKTAEHVNLHSLQPKECMQKIKAMKARAQASYESLKDLMDLRQKHANLSEARWARLQTEETSRQGNTIMVFTIVTILFLPASFMASFFALAISQFPRNANSMLDLGYVLKCTLIFTAVVATFFILMAFQINEIVALVKKIVGKDPKVPKTGSEKDEREPFIEKVNALRSRRAWGKSRGEDRMPLSTV